MAELGGLRLLLVDDDPTIARLVLQSLALSTSGSATHVTTAREALESLEGVDIVLLDHQLPDASGLEILQAIRARPNPPAVVLITAHGSESLAAGALRLGADDYLAKDPSLLRMLPQVIERVRRNRALQKALGVAERDLIRAERLAAIGEMTVALHHGINNPLMSASADVELLLSPGAMTETQRREALLGIQQSLHRIRDIVRQIGDLREVKTRAYLPGVSMVDLESAGPAAAPLHRGSAVVHVADEDLARIIALLLSHGGFSVQRCPTLAELQRAVDGLGVSLVVVVGGTDAAGAHPLGGFTPPAERGYRVVALVAGDGAAARAVGADQVVQLPFDPGRFTTDMVDLVS
jgi:CheY-like chemotaxis protein